MTITRPQDVFVLLKLVASPESGVTYAGLAEAVGMSQSQVYRSLGRAEGARLYVSSRRAPIRAALLQFLLHGVPYAFPATRGGRTRGTATSVIADPLRDRFFPGGVHAEGEVPVWPDAEGDLVGYAVEPLHPSVPAAARRDGGLYRLLALVDALREGRARERALATEMLTELVSHP